MSNPIEYELQSKQRIEEILREADQERLAKQAQRARKQQRDGQHRKRNAPQPSALRRALMALAMAF